MTRSRIKPSILVGLFVVFALLAAAPGPSGRTAGAVDDGELDGGGAHVEAREESACHGPGAGAMRRPR